MIFVTVGNAHTGFLRLLNAMEALAASGAFGDEPVIVQSGHNPEFTPRHCQARPFLGMEEFYEMIRAARVVICHAGAGTLSAVLRAGKTPVVVPRRLQYNEHIDDHQPQLLEALSARGVVVPAFEVSEISAAMGVAAARPPVAVESAEAGLAKVGKALEELLSGE